MLTGSIYSTPLDHASFHIGRAKDVEVSVSRVSPTSQTYSIHIRARPDGSAIASSIIIICTPEQIQHLIDTLTAYAPDQCAEPIADKEVA